MTHSRTDGSLITNSGFVWNAHSGTTGQTQVVSGKVQLSQNQTEDVHASLTNGPYSSGSLYASFVVNFSALPSGTGNYFLHFKDNGTTSFRAKVFATTTGAASGSFRVGVANVANSPTTISTDLARSMDYTLVLRYNAATPASTLWINPDSESSTNNRADATDTTTTLGITTIALRQSSASGNGMGVLTLDDLRVGTAFGDVVSNTPSAPPTITTQPQSQTVTEGADVTFSVVATGNPLLTYQLQFSGANLDSATNAMLTLTNVTVAQSGSYVAVVANSVGSTNSQPATLTVNSAPQIAFSLLTYNTCGNGAADWSTNAPQVQAIGRQMQYLQPDIITFNEIPQNYTYEMTNFVNVYLPGYYLAMNSSSDGFIRSVIASRFPITRSKSWLHGADLNPYGYTNANFTRDLFEAQIAVPGFAQPLHVFTAHLKADSDADCCAKRAAEASAISNFFVTAYLTTNALHPYTLSGDMNEDIARPPSTSQQPIQRLISAPTGLQLTTPTNPVTGSELTISIQASLTKRFDYIFPCGLLFSNIASSQVFRTDLLTNPPPPLQTNDDKTASDHLPVMMTFSNPFNPPFRLLSIGVSNQTAALTWESVPGQAYRLDSSVDLNAWPTLASNLMATGAVYTFTTNLTDATRFFRVYRGP